MLLETYAEWVLAISPPDVWLKMPSFPYTLREMSWDSKLSSIFFFFSSTFLGSHAWNNGDKFHFGLQVWEISSVSLTKFVRIWTALK